MSVNSPQTMPEGNKPVTLITRVRSACHRLMDAGDLRSADNEHRRQSQWYQLFKTHGLDLLAEDLKAELLRPLTAIRRDLPGFEDFAVEGQRGIEPGIPACSLLFHAFASPEVIEYPGGTPLPLFPTPAEIEAVENYVYGVEPPSFDDLRARTGDVPLAIVVFACEYRPALHTVHLKRADMCFSRTGICRVGSVDACYEPAKRTYLPFFLEDAKSNHIPVLPCRYAAYIAAQYPGDRDGFGPMLFQNEPATPPAQCNGAPTPSNDLERKFWVPLHKLFNGGECLRDHPDLKVTLHSHHINQKLKRLHLALAENGHDSGWRLPELDRPPFCLIAQLADFSIKPEEGTGLLIPHPHDPLVKIARQGDRPDGRYITFSVPVQGAVESSTVSIGQRPTGGRGGPEYVHARSTLDDKGRIVSLNTRPHVSQIVHAGGYRALNYVDYTAEGWIQAEYQNLACEAPCSLPAFSLIAPPDFFPYVHLQEMQQWWEQSAPSSLKHSFEASTMPPGPLCEARAPANLTLVNAQRQPVFDSQDDAIVAIIGFLDAGRAQQTRLIRSKSLRPSSLPDGASSTFAPGWDCGVDCTQGETAAQGKEKSGIAFLTNYGLGSPFPEDMKLCAAMSAFWPAAAPDVVRTFPPGNDATILPLTDAELGMGTGKPGWDGIVGPQRVPGAKEVIYTSFAYGDYVETALHSRFLPGHFAGMTTEEYVTRILIMAHVYETLGVLKPEDKAAWAVYSFMSVQRGDRGRVDAETQTRKSLASAHVYRFEMFQPQNILPGLGREFSHTVVSFEEMITLYADPQTVLKSSGEHWEVHEF